MTVRWHLPRETKEWIGPLTVTASSTSGAIPTFGFQIAVIPINTRPIISDWRDPDPNPSDATQVGVMLQPVAEEQVMGVWVKSTYGSNEIPVLEPDEVAYIFRT